MNSTSPPTVPFLEMAKEYAVATEAIKIPGVASLTLPTSWKEGPALRITQVEVLFLNCRTSYVITKQLHFVAGLPPQVPHQAADVQKLRHSPVLRHV